MSESLQVIRTQMSTGTEMLAKAQAFKELAAMAITTGLFPEGIKTVAQAVTIMWMGDAIGVHPMIAGQHIVPVHGKAYFQWRLKWGLVKSRNPLAELETVMFDDAKRVMRARVHPSRPWSTVEFTLAYAQKHPVLKKNPAYTESWPDMSKKACVHRLIDEIAPEVLLGLPSGEFGDFDASDDAIPPTPVREPSAAEVLGDAARKVEPVDAGGDAAAPARQTAAPSAPAPSPAAPSPAAAPATELFRDWNKELSELVNLIWNGGKKAESKGAWTNEKKRQTCSIILSEVRGEKVTLGARDTIPPSDAKACVELLWRKYPQYAGSNSGAVENGGSSGVQGDGAPAGESRGSTTAPINEAKGFDEQHADANEIPYDPEPDAPAVPPAVPPVVEVDADGEPLLPWDRDLSAQGVANQPPPLVDVVEVDAVRQAELDAAALQFQEDGNVLTIFALAKAGAGLARTFIMEHPANSKAFYFVDMPIVQARGRKSGILIQKDGAQAVDPDECRTLVSLMREAGCSPGGSK